MAYTVLHLPDDMLFLVFLRLHGSSTATLLAVCRRFRAVVHGNAKSVTLSRSYDGHDVDGAHVAAMARCAPLRRVDASGLGEDAQPWPLDTVTQITTLVVQKFWPAAAVPPAVPELRITLPDEAGSLYLATDARLLSLLSGLRGAACAVQLGKACFGDASDGEALSGVRARLSLTRAFATSGGLLAMPADRCVLSRLLHLHLRTSCAGDLAACGLPSLTSLHLTVAHIESLEALPASRLLSLSSLTLSGHALTTVQHVARLPCLRALTLRGCTSLSRLDASLPRLTALEISNALMMELGCESGDLSSLRSLTLQRTERYLRLDIARVLSHRSGFVRRSISGRGHLLPFPAGLTKLEQGLLYSVEFVTSRSELTPLTQLRVTGSWMLDLTCSPLVEDPLTAVETLSVTGCHQLTSFEGLWRTDALTHVEFHSCGALLSLEALSRASSLRRLTLKCCHSLRGLRGCEHVSDLNLHDCAALRWFDALPALSRLTGLIVCGIVPAGSVATPCWGRLRGVTLAHCGVPFGSTLQFLSSATQLTRLTLHTVAGLTSLRGLERSRALREVHLSNCDSLDGLEPLGLPFLTAIKLERCSGGLDGIVGASRLAVLKLSNPLSPLSTLLPLSSLSRLRRLVCADCRDLHSLRGVGRLPQRTFLHLSACSALASLQPLQELTSLQELFLEHCNGLRSLSEVAGVERFRRNLDVVLGPGLLLRKFPSLSMRPRHLSFWTDDESEREWDEFEDASDEDEEGAFEMEVPVGEADNSLSSDDDEGGWGAGDEGGGVEEFDGSDWYDADEGEEVESEEGVETDESDGLDYAASSDGDDAEGEEGGVGESFSDSNCYVSDGDDQDEDIFGKEACSNFF